MSSTSEHPRSEVNYATTEPLAAESSQPGYLSSIAKDTFTEYVAHKDESFTTSDVEKKTAEIKPLSGKGQGPNTGKYGEPKRVGEEQKTSSPVEDVENHEMQDAQRLSAGDLTGMTGGLSIHIPSADLDNPAPIESAEITSGPPRPPPPPKDDNYMPKQMQTHLEPSGLSIDAKKEAIKSGDENELSSKTDGESGDDQESEIASIMEQFGEDGAGGPGEAEIMSPRLDLGQPAFGSPTHPPRKSSLEILQAGTPDLPHKSSQTMQSPPPRSSSLITSIPAVTLKQQNITQEPSEAPLIPVTSKNLPPPPQPDPEPDLAFDFHRFLEQLRHKSADPVAKFLRSFLSEFAKRQWMVHEQVKIISDFLEFITKKMAQCEVWRTVSDAEFDNAREGMEKLVMNRLYTQTFSPAIPAPELSTVKGKRRAGGPTISTKSGRRGQHQEDVERDEVLAQKVQIYGWVKEEHLDIPPIGDQGRKFMSLAQQELLKIKSYRAPRDKVICVLNCCKVIFGFLRTAHHDQSADSFVPLLIYVVLQANPEHLVSNVQYILRFRHQDKLGGEAGYYISSLMGAVQFIENLDRTSLTISDSDFEKNVEAAVSAIAERHTQEEAQQARNPSPRLLPVSEKSAISRAQVTPRNSLEAEQSTSRRSPSKRNNGTKSDSEGEEHAAVAGLLRTIQRPLSTIGRMFSDDNTATVPSTTGSQSASTPQASNASRLPSTASRIENSEKSQTLEPGQPAIKKLIIEEAGARQASAEAEEARKIRTREESSVVETLSGMFPALDKDIIQDVVRANEGRLVPFVLLKRLRMLADLK